MYPNTCVVIDATRARAFELFQFSIITHELAGLVDVFLVTNENSATGEGAGLEDQRRLNLTTEEIMAPANNLKQATSILPGNADLKLLAAAANPMLARYDRFIRMEYDCVVAGPIRESFEKLCALSQGCDLAVTGFSRRSDEQSWRWWRSFGNRLSPDGQPPGPLYRGFLPLMIFSRRFIEVYREALAQGWTAHYEVLIPTVAAWNGMKIEDFAKHNLIDKTAFATRPKNGFSRGDSLFHHPMKNFTELSRLSTAIVKSYITAGEASLGGAPMSQALSCHARIRMSDAEMDLLKRCLLRSHRFLEFGGGGSTTLACHHGVQQIWTVETDAEFMLSLVETDGLREFERLGHLHLLHIDIGRTGAWGFPAPRYERDKWRRYFDLEWGTIRPDLVLIDGRFRVAVAARAYPELVNRPETIVLFHDFKGRPHYAPVLELYEIVESVDSLVALRPKTGMAAAASALFESHSQDFR